MRPAQYEVAEIGRTAIAVDVSRLSRSESLYFNATPLAGEYGKKPVAWLRSKDGEAYIQALLKVRNSHFENRESLVITRRGGGHSGTWLHNDLAIAFARWLDPVMAVKLDLWVKGRLAEEHRRRDVRLGAKTGFRPMTDAVKAAHADPKFYHYSNEPTMLCRLVTGRTPKRMRELFGVRSARDAMTADELDHLAELEPLNTSLIKRGMSYADRRDWLSDHPAPGEAITMSRGGNPKRKMSEKPARIHGPQ